MGQRAGKAFDALLPASCVACRRGVDHAAPLCALCRTRLPRLASPRCVRCAEPLGCPPGREHEFQRCGICEEWPDELGSADAPFAFDGVAADVVRALKYDGWRTLAPFMARSMAPAARRLIGAAAPDGARVLLVPVPLTASRLRERGFNQAEDLARGMAELGVGSVAPLLERKAGGGRQAASGGALRRANVRGRFVARRPPTPGDGVVVIVDDVLTTGSTAIACAEALAEAGFRRVTTVSFARTLRPLDPTGSNRSAASQTTPPRATRPERGSE